jgi:predicted PurR-regulated permease PerM
MRHGTNLPTVALFFGLAGGIEAYGPLGIFAGPAIMAIFSALLGVYRKTYLQRGDTGRLSRASTTSALEVQRPVEKTPAESGTQS